jgi:hypothetical protein
LIGDAVPGAPFQPRAEANSGARLATDSLARMGELVPQAASVWRAGRVSLSRDRPARAAGPAEPGGRGRRDFVITAEDAVYISAMDLRETIRSAVRLRRGRAAIPLVFSVALSGLAVAVFPPRPAPTPVAARGLVLVHRQAGEVGGVRPLMGRPRARSAGDTRN